jgi:hypothetical protein
MIVADKKPIEEIIEGQKLQTPPDPGLQRMRDGLRGRRQKRGRHPGLGAADVFLNQGREVKIDEITLERQCDHEYLEEIRDVVDQYDAILSIACGVGVQFTAEKYQATPVLPGVNTCFMGATENGALVERCQGCGQCILAMTGGICPVSRCAKRLFNGPCGGSTKGKCEISKEVDCAWQLIIDR